MATNPLNLGGALEQRLEPSRPYNKELAMRDVKDLMMSLSNLTSESVRHLRKTAEDPPRVSVLDLISAVTGDSNNCSTVYARLREQFPDVASTTSLFKFGGRGQRDTPITCVKGAVLIVMLLPGRAAATVRKQAASTLVRYLGGDLSLVDEIARNHLDQQDLDEDAPARLFGQQVESDSIKRKREEVTLAELDLQLCEQAGALKRRRIESVQYCLSALEAVGEVCDRDRLRAGDMVRTIAFGGRWFRASLPRHWILQVILGLPLLAANLCGHAYGARGSCSSWRFRNVICRCLHLYSSSTGGRRRRLARG